MVAPGRNGRCAVVLMLDQKWLAKIGEVSYGPEMKQEIAGQVEKIKGRTKAVVLENAPGENRREWLEFKRAFEEQMKNFRGRFAKAAPSMGKTTLISLIAEMSYIKRQKKRKNRFVNPWERWGMNDNTQQWGGNVLRGLAGEY